MTVAGTEFARALMEVLRFERAAQKVPLPELASSAGVAEATLRRYLKGYRAMPVSVFYEVAAALRVDPIEFFERAQQRLAPEIRTEPEGESLALRFDGQQRSTPREVGQRIALVVEILARGRGSRHGYREIAPILLQRGIRFSEDEWAKLLEGEALNAPSDDVLTKIAEVLGTEAGYLLGGAGSPDVVRIDAQLQFLREVQAGRVDGISARTTNDVTPETLRAITDRLRNEAPPQ